MTEEHKLQTVGLWLHSGGGGGDAEREGRGCLGADVRGQNLSDQDGEGGTWTTLQTLTIQCVFQGNPCLSPPGGQVPCHFPVRKGEQDSLLSGGGPGAGPVAPQGKKGPGSEGGWEKRAASTSFVSTGLQAPT